MSIRARRPLLLLLAAAALSSTAWSAHMPGPASYADVQGSSSASNLVNAGASSWVWFRNGAVVGNPTATAGASWAAGPDTPGATDVWAVTSAGIGNGSATSSAQTSLNRGELKAGVGVVSATGWVASGSASARLQDTLWFTNTSGSWLPVTLTMAVDGSATGALTRVEHFSYIGLGSVGGGGNGLGQFITARADGTGSVQSALYGEYYSMSGRPFGFRDQLSGAENDAIAHWVFGYGPNHLPGAGLYDYSKSITLYVPSGETTLTLDARMNIPFCAGLGACDFGHTASLRFGDLPDGLSFGSQSGVFLADVPAIPEPGTWALWLGGLGLIGRRLRRRA